LSLCGKLFPREVAIVLGLLPVHVDHRIVVEVRVAPVLGVSIGSCFARRGAYTDRDTGCILLVCGLEAVDGVLERITS
jgi:hypothetical protein